MRTSFKIVSVILGILMIASGIYCLATPGITFLAVGWIIGFNMIADAIGNIITWKDRKDEGMADGWTLAGAIVSLIFGIVLLGSNAMQLSVDLFVAYMAAIWLIVIGILQIVRIFILPAQASAAEVVVGSVTTKVMEGAQHLRVTIYLLLSAAGCIAGGIIGIIRCRELSAHLASIGKKA
jgi:uncharacterized membrane protein HdeD (DUF308 family)